LVAVDRRKRFVARAEAGRGWRIWDKQQKRWWGPVLSRQPDALLAELNGPKRPERLTELLRASS
jgi:hypothetical protein